MADDELPVVPSEVVGWRAWRVKVDEDVGDLRLWSLYREIAWPTETWLVSENEHGICAGLDRDHLEEMHQWNDRNAKRYVEQASAIGRVGLSGWITEGERGYRAEKARVISIIVPYVAWGLVAPLRHAYGVPVSLGNILHRGEMSWT